jgi:tetratricopeptide (TPR) repeat protein
MKPTQLKILFSVGAIVLFVLLFYAPRISQIENTTVGQSSPQKKGFNTNQTIKVYLGMAKKSLDKNLFDRLVSIQKKSDSNSTYFDSLVTFWDNLKRPDLAALQLEEKASKENKASDWELAGNRYYYSIRFVRDESEHQALFSSAARCFEKCLKIDPTIIDAKIMLASCLVESSGDPMSGISLLREVENVDSNNVKLQLTFAYLSINSGQKDKAIKRFEKVLEIDSTYLEAYLHLADLFEQTNKPEKTIEMLENYEAKTNDPTAKVEVAKYIKQLKDNINR